MKTNWIEAETSIFELGWRCLFEQGMEPPDFGEVALAHLRRMNEKYKSSRQKAVRAACDAIEEYMRDQSTWGVLKGKTDWAGREYYGDLSVKKGMAGGVWYLREFLFTYYENEATGNYGAKSISACAPPLGLPGEDGETYINNYLEALNGAKRDFINKINEINARKQGTYTPDSQ